jgi:pimeloyl-ACP methyl ester carboxylesterase
MREIAEEVMPAQRGRISDKEGLERAQRIMAAVPPDTYRKAVRLITTFDRREDLPKIAVPALLVAGSDDVTAPAQLMGHMAQKIPGAEFVVLRGCGHLGPMDQPGEFNKVLEGFLRRRKL